MDTGYAYNAGSAAKTQILARFLPTLECHSALPLTANELRTIQERNHNPDVHTLLWEIKRLPLPCQPAGRSSTVCTRSMGRRCRSRMAGADEPHPKQGADWPPTIPVQTGLQG